MNILSPTPASVAFRAVQSISRRSIGSLLNLGNDWCKSWDELWQNANGATPADILAELGTGGGDVMQKSRELLQYIVPILSAQTQPRLVALLAEIQTRMDATPDFTVGNDGTVTLG